MQAKEKPRVVIYGVGQFGQYNIRFAEQKGWPIVAAFNRAGEKVGKDIGRLAGLNKDLGVIVQDCDNADYSLLDADVALVTTTDQLSINITAYRRLMEAGLNIICHGVQSHYPTGFDIDLAKEIDRVAKKNNVSFTGSGIWDMSRVWAGLLAVGPCTEINSLYHKSTTNAAGSGGELMLLTGVGMSQVEFDEKMSKQVGPIGGMYTSVPQHVVAALGYTVTDVTERREPVLFEEPIYCEYLARELPPGTVVGMRIVGEVKTKEGVEAIIHHEGRLLRANEQENTYWSVKGKPAIRITIERDDQAHFSASSMFNRTRDVIAAPPGIQLLSQLGPLKHTALE